MHRSLLAASLFLAACPAEPPVSGAPLPAGSSPPEHAPAVQGPPEQGLVPSVVAPSDPGAAWQVELAAPVPALSADTSACPDTDGDGFQSALECPGGSADVLDCDDTDAAVGPNTERWVRPGPFLMGSDAEDAGEDEKPVHIVTLGGYCLDVGEVDTAAWAAWLAAKGQKPAGPEVRNLTADGAVAPGRGDQAAEGVTFEEASGYCKARGKVLPTEAQWEKAARGGCELGADPKVCDADDLRAYPWGDGAPDCTRANHQPDGGTPEPCTRDTLISSALPDGLGPYGHAHLAGNVWEFVADWWHPAVYGGKRVDPSGPRHGEIHVLRGGAWNSSSTDTRATKRFSDPSAGSATGFRCARPSVPAWPDKVARAASATPGQPNPGSVR